MDLPTAIDDPLAQPTRARLFALLNDLRRAASTEELAEQLKMHPNGVRLHLEHLANAGLLVRRQERGTRGRPRDSWLIDPDARPGGSPPTAYAELAGWLVRSLAEYGAGLPDIEEIGREIGHEVVTAGTGNDKEEQFYMALVTLGFQPRREPPGGDGVRYCLRNCPYRDAAHDRQPLVCGLHRGMTRGMLEVIAPDSQLADFVAKDPDTAGCEIELQGPVAVEHGPGTPES